MLQNLAGDHTAYNWPYSLQLAKIIQAKAHLQVDRDGGAWAGVESPLPSPGWDPQVRLVTFAVGGGLGSWEVPSERPRFWRMARVCP